MFLTRRQIWQGGFGLLATSWVPSSAALAVGEPTPELETLIDRHVAARGGRAVLDALRAMEMLMDIEEPTFRVQVRFVGSLAGMMRVDVFNGGDWMLTEGIDGGGAYRWGVRDAAATDASAESAAANAHGLEYNVPPLHRYCERGHRIALTEPEANEQTELHRLALTLRDGHRTFRYLDPNSWQIVGARDFVAPHPDLDSRRRNLITTFSDFREVDGISDHYLATQHDLDTRQRFQTMRILWRRYNPPLETERFSRLTRPAPLA